METSKTVTKEQESAKPLHQNKTYPKSSNIPRLSSFAVDPTKTISPNLKHEVPGFKKKEKPNEAEKKKCETKRGRSKSREDNKGLDIQTCIPVRDRGKFSRGKLIDKKKKNRDYQKFRTKFNSSAGNILKDWMNLIYCILILRMNLIKFVTEQMPHCGSNEINFQKQILIESKNIYELIKNAQNFSQEQFLFLWKELERVIFSYVMLKNSLESRKQVMVKIQNDVNKLKVSQNDLLKSYTNKIEFLKNQIEEKEEEIKVEKEQKNKIRTDLAEWFGDSAEN